MLCITLCGPAKHASLGAAFGAAFKIFLDGNILYPKLLQYFTGQHEQLLRSLCKHLYCKPSKSKQYALAVSARSVCLMWLAHSSQVSEYLKFHGTCACSWWHALHGVDCCEHAWMPCSAQLRYMLKPLCYIQACAHYYHCTCWNLHNYCGFKIHRCVPVAPRTVPGKEKVMIMPIEKLYLQQSPRVVSWGCLLGALSKESPCHAETGDAAGRKQTCSVKYLSLSIQQLLRLTTSRKSSFDISMRETFVLLCDKNPHTEV